MADRIAEYNFCHFCQPKQDSFTLSTVYETLWTRQRGKVMRSAHDCETGLLKRFNNLASNFMRQKLRDASHFVGLALSRIKILFHKLLYCNSPVTVCHLDSFLESCWKSLEWDLGFPVQVIHPVQPKLNKFIPSPQTCILFKRCITLSTGKITSSSADRQENQSSSVAPGQRFVTWIALSFQLGRIGQWNMAWRHLQMKIDEGNYSIQLREQF